MRRLWLHARSRRFLAAWLAALSVVAMGVGLGHAHPIAHAQGDAIELVDADRSPVPAQPPDPSRLAGVHCHFCLQHSQAQSVVGSRCEPIPVPAIRRPLELAIEPTPRGRPFAGALPARGPPTAV